MVRVLVASSPVPLFSRAGRRAAWQIEVEKPRLPGVKGRGASRCIVPFIKKCLRDASYGLRRRHGGVFGQQAPHTTLFFTAEVRIR